MQMYDFYNTDLMKNRSLTMSSGYEPHSIYPNGLKTEDMDIDPLNKYEYNRHESPCSPSMSNASSHSANELHIALTPPATPYTNGTVLQSCSPNKRNLSPSIALSNMSRGGGNGDAMYYGRSINDDYYYHHRSDSYMSPGTSSSGRDNSKYGTKLNADPYPTGIYSNQLHQSSSYSMASCNSTPSPSNSIIQYNHTNASIATTFTTSALDTDVDPKELDQYLHNQAQMRRVAAGPVYGLKTEDNLLELQPISTIDSNFTADKYELNGGPTAEVNPNGNYYDNPYQYQYTHSAWGSYSN